MSCTCSNGYTHRGVLPHLVSTHIHRLLEGNYSLRSNSSHIWLKSNLLIRGDSYESLAYRDRRISRRAFVGDVLDPRMCPL